MNIGLLITIDSRRLQLLFRTERIIMLHISLPKKSLTVVMLTITMLVISTASFAYKPQESRNSLNKVPTLIPTIKKETETTAKITEELIKTLEQSQTASKTEPKLNINTGFQESDGSSCGITCLTCEKGECTRYNWIAVICLGLLVVNLLALFHCINLVRKMKGRPTTKDSLITEGSGSLVRSLAQE